jgi:hypothetical protein
LAEAQTLADKAVEAYQTRMNVLKDSVKFARDDNSKREFEFQSSGVELELAMALGTLGQIRYLQREFALAIAAWKASYDLLPLNLTPLRAKRLLHIARAFNSMGIVSQERTYLQQARAVADDPVLIKEIDSQLSKFETQTTELSR